MQVVLVYLQRVRRSSLLKCLSQPEIAKNLLKTPTFGVQGRSRSSILVPPECLLAVRYVKQQVCVYLHRSHARRANNGKITIS